MTGDDHPRSEVALILRLSLSGHLPPAVVFAENLRVAASVDDAIAHDADILRIHDADKWPASATSWRWPLRSRKDGRWGTCGNRATQSGCRTRCFIERCVAR